MCATPVSAADAPSAAGIDTYVFVQVGSDIYHVNTEVTCYDENGNLEGIEKMTDAEIAQTAAELGGVVVLSYRLAREKRPDKIRVSESRNYSSASQVANDISYTKYHSADSATYSGWLPFSSSSVQSNGKMKATYVGLIYCEI